MTAKEKEEIKSRLKRAEHLERTLEIVTDAMTVIQHPELPESAYECLSCALRQMPNEYRDAISDVIKKWGEQLNEEYKKL